MGSFSNPKDNQVQFINMYFLAYLENIHQYLSSIVKQNYSKQKIKQESLIDAETVPEKIFALSIVQFQMTGLFPPEFANAPMGSTHGYGTAEAIAKLYGILTAGQH